MNKKDQRKMAALLKKRRKDKDHPTSEDGSRSVRTVRGGAVESNRRRH